VSLDWLRGLTAWMTSAIVALWWAAVLLAMWLWITHPPDTFVTVDPGGGITIVTVCGGPSSPGETHAALALAVPLPFLALWAYARTFGGTV
jgi:hypothetical protein